MCAVKHIRPVCNEGARAVRNEVQNMAWAGTGSPINDDFCRASVLNFASRKAEKTGIANEHSIKILIRGGVLHCVEVARSFKKQNSIMPGATPKLTMSARESRSLPIGEQAFSSRAAKPSAKSKSAAANIAVMAYG